MPVDPLAPDAPDLAEPLQGPGRTPRDVQGLAVGQQHVRRHPFSPRLLAPPGEQSLVPCTLDLVQVFQQSQERRLLRLLLLVEVVSSGQSALLRRAGARPLERARLQEHRPHRPSLLDAEPRLVPQHLAIRQVLAEALVVEHAGPGIEGDGDDP